MNVSDMTLRDRLAFEYYVEAIKSGWNLPDSAAKSSFAHADAWLGEQNKSGLQASADSVIASAAVAVPPLRHWGRDSLTELEKQDELRADLLSDDMLDNCSKKIGDGSGGLLSLHISAKMIRELQARRAADQAIPPGHPRTEDGVVMYIGMTVWTVSGSAHEVASLDHVGFGGGEWATCPGPGRARDWEVRPCYSTEEAARAGQEEARMKPRIGRGIRPDGEGHGIK